MSAIKISYIIITWNGLDYLRRLLSSMSNQLAREDVEVIITDNGSTDGTIEFLQHDYPAIRLICLQQNMGVAYARNLTMRQAHGKYLFILDNDIQITDESVVAMEQYMDSHPQVGICGSKLLYPDGTTQHSCKTYPGISEKLRSFCRTKSSVFPYEKQINGTEPFEPVYIIGACQMIRREVYEAIGDLDDTIFYGPEDCDYCLRTRKAGWRVIYLPNVAMYHHCQRRTHTKPFSKLGWLHIKALMYFYWKYKKI